MNQRGYISIVLVATMLVAISLVAVGAHEVGISGQRAFSGEWDVIQARLAADTGVERALDRLLVVPSTRDGSFATGAVGDRARVETVTIEYDADTGVITVTAAGVSGRARRTSWARVLASGVPLMNPHGGGIKVIGNVGTMEIRGDVYIQSDMLVNGNIDFRGEPQIGIDGEERSVYALGCIVRSGGELPIRGWAYATGTIAPSTATLGQYPGWEPAVPVPDTSDIGPILDGARVQAQMLEAATGQVHYFASDAVLNLANLSSGVYFVDGSVTVGGVSDPDAHIFVGAAGNMVLSGDVQAPVTVLVTGGDMDARNALAVNVAVLLAEGDIGWSGVGGSTSMAMNYGVLGAGSLNSSNLWGDVQMIQRDDIDVTQLSGAVDSFVVLGRGGD